MTHLQNSAISSSPAGQTAPLILVVDDDAVMAFLIGSILEGSGYCVRTVTDGEEAIKRAATQPPDLLLIDLTMPRLSGADTMAQLRELLPTLPILVISGLSQAESRIAAPIANGFLGKPFKAEALLRAVTSLRPCP